MLPDGEATGIFKAAAGGPVRLTPTGLEGDEQADLRHHGGVDKALHHYPVEHYAVMAQAWPQCAAMLVAGVLGENISTFGMTEHEVCIGDIFRLGGARVQVSQPRSPCWKIDRRLKVDDASRFVEAAGITGQRITAGRWDAAAPEAPAAMRAIGWPELGADAVWLQGGSAGR